MHHYKKTRPLFLFFLPLSSFLYHCISLTMSALSWLNSKMMFSCQDNMCPHQAFELVSAITPIHIKSSKRVIVLPISMHRGSQPQKTCIEETVYHFHFCTANCLCVKSVLTLTHNKRWKMWLSCLNSKLNFLKSEMLSYLFSDLMEFLKISFFPYTRSNTNLASWKSSCFPVKNTLFYSGRRAKQTENHSSTSKGTFSLWTLNEYKKVKITSKKENTGCTMSLVEQKGNEKR